MPPPPFRAVRGPRTGQVALGNQQRDPRRVDARETLLQMEVPGPPRLRSIVPHTLPSLRELGVVSGSFDPPTLAHLALAHGLHDMGCEVVALVYSVRTLPKEVAPGGLVRPALLDPVDRLACLAAVCEGRPWLGVAVCSHGLLAEQAEAAARACPGARVILGMGSDKVLQLLDPRWYDDRDAALEALFARASVAYAPRSGQAEAVVQALARPHNLAWAGAISLLDVPREIWELSSRQVRERLASGEVPTEWLPPEVVPFVVRASGCGVSFRSIG